MCTLGGEHTMYILYHLAQILRTMPRLFWRQFVPPGRAIRKHLILSLESSSLSLDEFVKTKICLLNLDWFGWVILKYCGMFGPKKKGFVWETFKKSCFINYFINPFSSLFWKKYKGCFFLYDLISRIKLKY